MVLKNLLGHTHEGTTSDVARNTSIMATRAAFGSNDFGHLVHMFQAEHGLTLEMVIKHRHWRRL